MLYKEGPSGSASSPGDPAPPEAAVLSRDKNPHAPSRQSGRKRIQQ